MGIQYNSKCYILLLLYDSQGLVSHILRFLGKMLTDNPIDKDRTFIISFYLSDDTITVYEPIQKNSGMSPSLPSYCHSLLTFAFSNVSSVQN